MAVLAGVEQAVQIHIDRGDDLNARDSNGLTLLMLSAAKNKPAMCRLLLSAGADDSLLDPTGRTAHAIAIATGSQQAADVFATLAMAKSEEILASGTSFITQVEHVNKVELAPDIEHILENAPILIEAPTPQIIAENFDCDVDINLWEPEEELLPPEIDTTLVADAIAVQAAISAHEPIDSSADWDDH